MVGGGPAGTATARQLALLGHSVVLLHAPEPARGGAVARGPEVESLPPSAAALVGALGLAEPIAASAIERMPGNAVAWANTPIAETRFAEPGFQVQRPELDRRLLFACAAAGVDVEEARVRSLDLGRQQPGREGPRQGAEPAAPGEPIALAAGEGGDTRQLTCDVLILATGRRGLSGGARRTMLKGWRTLAITGAYGGPAPTAGWSRASTWIESTDQGWAWSVPLAGGRRQVTVMIDPPKQRGLTGRALEAFYRAEVARARETAAWYAVGDLEWVRAVDCTPSFVANAASQACIRVGDAACNVDPLASFGLKKAFLSARIGAAVAHTIRQRPACAEAAVAEYNRLQQVEFGGSMAGAAAEAARARAAHDTAFWQRRTFRPARARAAAPLEAGPETPLPSLPAGLRLGRGARVEERAVLEGWLFELRPVVVSERWPQGLRYVSGLTVPLVVEAACAAPSTSTIAQHYGQLAGTAVDPAVVQRVLAQLVRWEILEPRECTRRPP